MFAFVIAYQLYVAAAARAIVIGINFQLTPCAVRAKPMASMARLLIFSRK